MNFFEQELQRIVGARFPQTTYVGRACYVPLGEQLRAKIQFVTCGYADHYEALRATILNRHEGEVDTNLIRLSDVLGGKQVANPNFPKGMRPHIWVDGAVPEWYVYKPTAEDYDTLGKTLQSYLDIFQEQRQADASTQQFQQTM